MAATDIIRTPGKFEGEPEYLVTLWDRLMEGGSDETIHDGETAVEVFILSPDEQVEFDTDAYAILVWEDDNGFVSMSHVSEEGLSDFAETCQDDVDDDPWG